MSMQKFLARTMNASVSILSEIHSSDFSVQSITQKTVDIAAISLKRSVFIRSIMNNEYKDLCSSNQPVSFCFNTIFPRWSKN